jgi:hypothetical protein
MLSNLDATLDAFGAWDACDVHFRYMAELPISAVGHVTKSTPTAFWANNLTAFKSNCTPAEIDTQAIKYSTKKCALWVRSSFNDIAKDTLQSVLQPRR